MPEKGVRGFPENRYVEDLLRMKKTHQCLKHFLPLHLFCDNEECQVQICSSCAPVKHNGHKLVDIEDKAVQLRSNMANTRERAREISLALGAHLEELNRVLEKVNKTTSENLDAVDNTREELHKKIQELHKKVQTETEDQKMKLLQNQKKELAKLNKAKEEALHSKTLFDGLYMDVEKLMTLSNNEIVQINETLENSFLKLKMNEVRGKKYDAETNIILHDKPQSITQLKFEDTGKLRTEPLAIKPPSIIKEIKEQLFIPETKLLRTIDTELEEWTKIKMCVSNDGHVVLSGKIKDENLLHCFNTNGDHLWQVKMGKADNNIKGLASSPNNEHFFLAMNRRIEMRNVSDGQKICEHDVDFSCGHLFCSSDNMLLVINKDYTPLKLVKFDVKCEPVACLETLNEVVETNLNNLFGYTMLNCINKQLLIVTSWQENTIKAIDYLTGNTEWSTTGEYEGKKIKPHEVCCDDIGNLYIADGTNNRVFLVSPEGKIKQRVIDTPNATFWIGFTEANRLVINVQSDKQKLHVYQVIKVLEDY